MTATRYALNEPSVVYERLDGEVIVIHLATGSYYNLQGTADVLWTFALAGWSASEILDRLAEGSGPVPPDLAAAITGFLDHLAAEDLLADRGATPREALPDLLLPSGFAAPEIQKFTDMQELMLVDPIHEVTDAGWPQVAPSQG